MTRLRVNGQRLWQSLEHFAGIGATGRGGCNRQALTDADRQGRDTFSAWARAAGCTVTVDAVGNLYARRGGTQQDAAAVLASSHLDTQATGGRYDGVYGVLAGLEVLRVLDEHKVRTRRPIEVVSWTNEEGCRFVPAMLGSGTVAGTHELGFALERRDAAGRSVGEELDRIGYRGSRPAQVFPVHASFEAHIEQGPVLERDGATIGVVTGIQGLHWLDVVLTGASCHAGPTPMDMRQDPWRAATRIIAGALALADARPPWARCTVGDVRCLPGARNTVPETVRIAIDIRHPQHEVLEQMRADLTALVAGEAARARVPGADRSRLAHAADEFRATPGRSGRSDRAAARLPAAAHHQWRRPRFTEHRALCAHHHDLRALCRGPQPQRGGARQSRRP